tara:strand:+ start:664 stop:846 length:183 start_codon:yes stop_codon:yes gene_type:complete
MEVGGSGTIWAAHLLRKDQTFKLSYGNEIVEYLNLGDWGNRLSGLTTNFEQLHGFVAQIG